MHMWGLLVLNYTAWGPRGTLEDGFMDTIAVDAGRSDWMPWRPGYGTLVRDRVRPYDLAALGGLSQSTA